MDIKNAIDYAQLALKKASEENKIKNKELTIEEQAEQLGQLMWLMYYNYNEVQAHKKATEILKKSEAKYD